MCLTAGQGCKNFESKSPTLGCGMHYVVQLSHAYNTWSDIIIDMFNGRLWPAGRTSVLAVHLQKHCSGESADTSEAISPGIVQPMCQYTMWCNALLYHPVTRSAVS